MKKNELERFPENRIWQKAVLIMKLTTILYFFCLMQVSATVYSQATKFTFRAENKQIVDVLREIEDNSDFRFFYQNEQIDMNRSVSLNASNVTVEHILNEIFKGEGVNYKVLEDNLVILSTDNIRSKKESAKNVTVKKESQLQQQNSISGKITDQNGQPLPGVTILVKGTNNGTVTNVDGEYSLSDFLEDATLRFTFIGMQTQEIEVGNQTTLDVTMLVDAIGLEEVVAIGYGTQKRQDLTAAISVVDSDQLANKPLTNSTQALQGVKGLYVNQTGGQPGRSQATIRIRGLGTLNNNNPLVLVDGIESSLDDINSNDIDNISVLKDAAAAAIYGSRAASGVILITTKTGENVRGFHVNYNNYVGFQEVIGLPNFITDPVQVLEMTNEAKINAGEQPWYSDEMIEEYRQGMKTDPVVYPHNDWFDIMFSTGFIQNHNLRFTGGADNTNFSLSLGYQDHNGVMMGSNSDKYSISFNSNSNITDKLSIGVKFNGQLKKFDEAVSGSAHLMEMTFKNAGLGYEPTYYKDGLYGNHWFITRGHYQFRNPIALATEGMNNHNQEYFHIILDAKYNFTKNLTYKIKGAYAKRNNLNTQFEPLIYQYDVKTGASKNILIDGSAVRRAEKSMSNNYDLNLQQTLGWEKSFIDPHKISALAGFEVKEFNYNNLWGYKEGYLGNGLTTLNAGSTNPKAEGTNSRNSLMSFFGRVQYNYNSKYLFEGNFRYDGSSRFAEGQKWGLFPSFSAGWRIGQENFMSEIGWLDDLKIRASWGQLGNERVPSYRYVNLVNLGYDYSFGNTIAPGAAISAYNDPSLTWETSTTSNIGIDAYFLNSLSFSFEVFKKRTSDILHNVNIPTQVGDLTGPLKNIGVVDNKGYELGLSYRNTKGDFSYEVSGTLMRIKNEVVDLDGEIVYEYGARSQGGTIIKEGYPIQSYYMLKADGIFDTQEEIDNHAFQTEDTKPGYIRFEDVNNDGVINQDDRVILDENRIPKYTGSLNLNLSYKNFSVSAFFNGVQGVYTFRAKQGDVPFWYGTGITDEWVNNTWTPENMDAKLPILTTYEDAVNTNFRSSDFLLQNASYMRLKNLQISYNLPASLTEKVNIGSAKFFVNAENLWTLTKMTGFDPERNMDTDNSAYDYPSVKTFTCGIEIDF